MLNVVELADEVISEHWRRFAEAVQIRDKAENVFVSYSSHLVANVLLIVQTWWSEDVILSEWNMKTNNIINISGAVVDTFWYLKPLNQIIYHWLTWQKRREKCWHPC